MAVGRAKRAAAGGRAEADGRDFVPVGGGVLLYGNTVRTGHAYAQSDGAGIVCAVFGNDADCAGAGVAVCAVFRVAAVDGAAFGRNVGVRVRICTVGHGRDG